jgi:hypothetical protein
MARPPESLEESAHARRGGKSRYSRATWLSQMRQSLSQMRHPNVKPKLKVKPNDRRSPPCLPVMASMLRRALGFFWPLDDGQRDRKPRLGAADQLD